MRKSILKKVLAVAVIGVMGLGIVSCANSKLDKGNKSKEKTEATDSLTIIKEKGELVVGLNADYAPYEFHILEKGEDKIVGFDINIAEEIAKDMGVKLVVKDMEFDSLLSALTGSKLDLIISGMSPTEERKKSVDFSDIYYLAEHGIVVRAENKDKYKSFLDLNNKKVGAQMGSIQAGLAKDNIENVDLQLLSNVTELLVGLKAGKIEALIVELPVAEMIVKNNEELAIAEEKIKDESSGSAIAIKKDSKELVVQVNKTIKKIIDEKLLDKFIIDANDLAGK
ncbi:transporter substrate-binding domain-containing protein [Clostridium sp.]|uniref:transporter substrate-binding domain-containing protein n=1 Tax=Clostridium sp. TaxID=1506 RepID=UPI002605DF3B|nr:transporter substrate-binding domain-containing protein [Clostridium sp.]